MNSPHCVLGSYYNEESTSGSSTRRLECDSALKRPKYITMALAVAKQCGEVVYEGVFGSNLYAAVFSRDIIVIYNMISQISCEIAGYPSEIMSPRCFVVQTDIRQVQLGKYIWSLLVILIYFSWAALPYNVGQGRRNWVGMVGIYPPSF